MNVIINNLNFLKRKSARVLMSGAWAAICLSIFSAIIVGQNRQLQSIDEKRYKPQLIVQTGHSDTVFSVVFSPDGKVLASGSVDKTIKLWNVETGQELRTLSGHGARVNTVVFSPDGKVLASGSSDHLIKLWNVETGEELKNIEGHSDWVFSVKFSPDGKVLASGSRDKTVKLWNIETGREIKTLTGHADTVMSIVFALDGKTLASGSLDKTIKLWSVTGGQEIKSFAGHSESINAVAFALDGRTLASGGSDKTIKLWNIETGQETKTLTGHTEGVMSIVFAPDGRTLASGGADKNIKSWNVASGQEIKSFAEPNGYIVSVAFSPNGKTVASGVWSHDHTIRLRDIETGLEILTLRGRSSQILSVAFSPDGRRLASGVGFFGDVQLWNIETGQAPKILKGSLGRRAFRVDTLKFSLDGKTLASNNGNVNFLNLWDVESGKEIKYERVPPWVLGNNRFNVVNINGRKIQAEQDKAQIKLSDFETKKEIGTLIAIDDQEWVVFTPEGRFDASEDAQRLMHYSYGLEIINLEQLKEMYYEPGLLQKLLGFNRQPLRPVVAIGNIKLHPEIVEQKVEPKTTKLNIKLKNRGGGIGRVEVRVNGNELTGDARAGKAFEPTAKQADLTVEIPPKRLRAGASKIEVVAWNLDGSVRSRGSEINFNSGNERAETKGVEVIKISVDKKPSEINFYAIVSGISDYEGSALDLRYAAKDAEDISKALTLAARKYFCNEELAGKKPCGRVHLRLLSTEKEKSSQFAGLPDVADFQRLEPTKQNYQNVFSEIAQKAKPEDVVIVYLSGHGTAITSAEAIKESAFPDMYLYATRDATTLDRAIMVNQSERLSKTVNSLELAKWVSEIKADKKVMIFDTCAAGAAQKDLTSQTRAVDALQVRSIDRLRERTGFYILMGSAADAVSYEANEFRQGLLTYSLIEAMTNDKGLRDGKFLDVEKWFASAEDKVENLAKGIGGVQRPSFFKSNFAKTFDIGRIEREEQLLLPLAQRVPLILQPELREAGKFTDKERLTEKLEVRLLEQSASNVRGEGAAVNYIKATTATNGLSPRGFYTFNTDETITIDVSLIRDEEEIAKVKVTATKVEIIEKLLQEIIKAVQIKNI